VEEALRSWLRAVARFYAPGRRRTKVKRHFDGTDLPVQLLVTQRLSGDRPAASL